MEVYRQGDVCLIPIARIPKDAVKLQTKIIRKGEHGGMHRLSKESIAAIYQSARYMNKSDGKTRTDVKFVRAYRKKGAEIIHPRAEGKGHNKVPIPKGDYEVRIQREGEGDSESRYVAD